VTYVNIESVVDDGCILYYLVSVGQTQYYSEKQRTKQRITSKST